MTDEDKYHCARRELMMREKVYPKWVKAGRMSETTAQREIDLMEAIMNDYREKLMPIPNLFDEPK